MEITLSKTTRRTARRSARKSVRSSAKEKYKGQSKKEQETVNHLKSIDFLSRQWDPRLALKSPD